MQSFLPAEEPSEPSTRLDFRDARCAISPIEPAIFRKDARGLVILPVRMAAITQALIFAELWLRAASAVRQDVRLGLGATVARVGFIVAIVVLEDRTFEAHYEFVTSPLEFSPGRCVVIDIHRKEIAGVA